MRNALCSSLTTAIHICENLFAHEMDMITVFAECVHVCEWVGCDMLPVCMRKERLLPSKQISFVPFAGKYL